MGMFDQIVVDPKWLPEDDRIPVDEQDFQTKNFDCLLELYEILDDGTLFRTRDVDGWEMIEEHKFTGEIQFYDLERNFVAWCVDGIVKEVIKLKSA